MRSYKLHGSGASKDWSRRGGAGGGTEPTDVAGGQSHPGLGQPWSTRCWTSTHCFDIYIWIPRRCGILTTTGPAPPGRICMTRDCHVFNICDLARRSAVTTPCSGTAILSL